MVATGCIPLVVPPARVEVSEGSRSANLTRDDHPAPSGSIGDTRFAVGMHVANIVSKVPFDAGGGVVLTDFGPGVRVGHGAYVEAGGFVEGNPAMRLFLGVRAETTSSDRGTGYTAYARIAGEAHIGVPATAWENSVGAGAVAGVTAFGWFIEAGPQTLPGEARATILAGGVWIRLPAMGAIVCCVPAKVALKAIGGALK